MLEEYRKRREYVVGRLRAMPGVTCAMPKGAFYAFPNVSHYYGRQGIANSLDFSEQLLNKALVAAVPGGAFGAEDYLRISYACSMADLEKGLDRIEKFLAELV
jgi:aspartate aminotransferase